VIGGSLTGRAIMAAAVAIVVALVVVGFGVDVLVARHLNGSLDSSLRARATEVARLSATAPALLTVPGSLDAPLGGEQSTVQVIDGRGRIVARSLSLGGRVLQLGAAGRRVATSGAPRFVDLRLGSDHLRAYVAPLPATGGIAGGGVVAVAASTDSVADTLSSVRVFVVGAAVVAAAVAALALALLMRRALSPLGRLTAAAAEIEETGDARRRLPLPESGDELTRLGATLNRMLAALERARDRERRFVADASHELRTPLTALSGNVAFLAQHGASDELVAELEHDTRRLAALADDLLALSREEAAAPPSEVVRLDELAREAEGADDVLADPVAVRGDRAALARALGNLVENARLHGTGRVIVESAASNGLATLTVADEGSGLPHPEAELAFGRFWRGATGSGGSGLGLAIVRATAERHGGRAYADGARFTIELPAVALRDLSESAATTSGEEQRKGPS
jgi:two-component system, OmpR family, sensor kinase